MKNYKSNPRFAKLLKEFQALKKTYDGIKIVTTDTEPISKIVNGMLVIKQTSKSTVHITDEQIDQITTEVNDLRNKVINNNI